MAAREGRQSLEDLLAERQLADPPVVTPPPRPQRAVRAVSRPPGPATSPSSPPPRMSPRSAVEAVQRARESARDDPRSWEAFTVKLPGVLVQRLNQRLATDQTVTHDFGLALCHYLEAAFAAVPSDVSKAAAWGLAWRKRATGPARPAPAGSRLHRDTALAMHLLPGRLRTLERKPAAWEIMAEALARLLDGLDGGT